MFGFSFSELVVVVLVALVAIGPKDLPNVLRRLGRWAATLRQTATALRAQSGIDEILRSDGLAEDLAEIRKLARGELEAVQDAVRVEVETEAPTAPKDDTRRADEDVGDAQSREYPCDGADAYGALQEDSTLDVEVLRPSRWAADRLYVLGEPDAELVGASENGGERVMEGDASTPDEPAPRDEASTEDVDLPRRERPNEAWAEVRA